ncbi:NAD(P)/FAD-dependent oxidoreductase [Halococcoides cellulosivorans]|uniref:Thioredoxin-disulfide reductase n=1 Tax=Halococcoides cellulosivorans TaxID=1679096 RepID=A0A2R4X2E2_9EURY|nr:NAD(P)/FAD-dependent oxidoreductase [Halococcoides cellulosivorans]AWB27944.1 thioredoxin-disulfide reductase [Halococcoides cellulosivorans]
MAEIAIVGGGPAGLAAAVYTARADRETIVFDSGEGTTASVDWMENVYGFPEGIAGPDIVARGREHAERFGAEIIREEVVRIADDGEGYTVETTDSTYSVTGVVLATGSSYETPAIAGIDDYEGQGVSYCVECDAFFYRDQTVGVVGAGNYAAKEATMLLDYTDDVTVYTNGTDLTMDEGLRADLDDRGIPIVEESIADLHGDGVLEAITVDGRQVPIDGLFVALGAAGGTDLAEMLGVPVLDDEIQVESDQSTGVDRVYAAGDVTGGQRQVNVSIGEGTTAAIALLESLRGGQYVDYKKVEA